MLISTSISNNSCNSNNSYRVNYNCSTTAYSASSLGTQAQRLMKLKPGINIIELFYFVTATATK
jgi:hypothetical protein